MTAIVPLRWVLTVAVAMSSAAAATPLPPPVPPSCQRPPPVTRCMDAGRELTGIFVARGDGVWQPHDAATPLTVGDRQRVAISVCGYGNHTVDRAHWPALQSLVPTLVRSVGRDATVAVLVERSANVTVVDRLALGESGLSTGQPAGNAEPALVATLIQGPIGEGARIDVRVRDTANVRLAGPQSQLHIGGGSLMDALIDQLDAPDASAETLQTAVGACINVDILRASRVTGGHGRLTIDTGQLENELIDYGLHRSRVDIALREVANVAVESVRIFDGELIDETIDAQALIGDDVWVRHNDSANVAAAVLDIEDGELIDEIIDGERVEDSRIRVAFDDSGNAVLTGGLSIRDGELIDEAVDVEDVMRSTVDVRLLRSANASISNASIAGTGVLEIVEGELVDETIDGETYADAALWIAFTGSGNAEAANVDIQAGELIDEALDGAGFVDSELDLRFLRSGNVSGRQLSIAHGELIDEMVDAEDRIERSRVTVTVTGSANASVESLAIADGELLDEILDADQAVDASVRIDVLDTANVRGVAFALGQSVRITRGELMDEAIDVAGRIQRSTADVIILNTANAQAARIVLNDAQLLDAVVDAGEVLASTLRLTQTNAANASYRDELSLIGSSRLLDGILNANRVDAGSTLIGVPVASGRAITLP